MSTSARAAARAGLVGGAALLVAALTVTSASAAWISSAHAPSCAVFSSACSSATRALSRS